MAKKKSTLLPILAAVGAGMLYGAYKGKGIFNKPRFQKQHDAVSRYVSTHYPGAFYDPIQTSDNGWMTVIRWHGQNISLFITRTEQGDFVFSELK